MPTSPGCIRVCRLDQGVAFAVIGQGCMHDCPTLRQAADEAIAGGVGEVLIDLSRCSYIDSTFVGTLIYLRKAAGSRPGGRFAVVCPSDECMELFRQMGIARLLCVERCELPPDERWAELPEHFDAEQFRRNVLMAHEELANLPGEAGAPFRELAQRMREEWDAGR